MATEEEKPRTKVADLGANFETLLRAALKEARA